MPDKLIAYVPARGGSKRIPRKNIRAVGGIPVLGHVLTTLKNLSFVEHVCVSTEDPEISEVARAYGATILEPRATHLSDDHTSLVQLLRDDVRRYLDHFNQSSDRAHVLMVLPTAALVPVEIYESAYRQFVTTKSRLLFSSKSYESSPFRALTQRADGTWTPLFPQMLLTRTQDLPPTQVDSGLFYLLHFKTLSEHKDHWFTLGAGVQCCNIPERYAVDVDTPEDWAKLEQRFLELQKEETLLK